MSQAKDDAFSSCVMGNGVVIEPEIGVVTAPADGEITLVMEPSLHAVGLKTKEGLNVLLHIGIDTVKLDGKGFQSFVKQGQKVAAGETLITFDKELIEREGLCPDVLMIVIEEGKLPGIQYHTGIKAKAGKTLAAEY